MKTLVKTLRIVVAITVMLAIPHFASGATKKFTVSVSPLTTNVMANLATNVAIIVTDTSPSGNTFNAVVTNSVIVSPAGQGVTASYSLTSSVTTSNSPTVPAAGSASLTLYVSATAAATPNIVYTITATGTNSSATGNTPISGYATAIYQFTVGTPPQIIWSPAGVNSNWSNAGNWSPSSVPNILNDVTFLDNGGTNAPDVTNNVVDNNFSVGSLTYGQTNNYNTTLIASGKTLTASGDTIGLIAGTGTDDGNITTFNAITGPGGTLLLTNPGANIFVSQSHVVNTGEASAQATLDLSGLGNLNAKVSRLLVGADVNIKGASGVLNLAQTNIITVTVGSTAPQIDVGDNTQSQGSTAISSTMLLGVTNGIYADSIAVGRGKTDGTIPCTMAFNSAFANPTAYIRGTNGSSSRVGTWTIGDGYGSKVTTFTTALGNCDFSSGTVNALVNTMYVGKGSDPSIIAGATYDGQGTLTMAAGTINVNTLNIGYDVIPGTGGLTPDNDGFGTVNAYGGAIVVNTLLLMGYQANSSGTLNISNAMVAANSGVSVGGGSATINMAAGTLSVTNGTATIGTSTAPLNTLSVSNSTLDVSIQNFTPSVEADNLVADGTVNTINISSIPVLNGFPAQFQVIQYGLNGGSSSGNTATFVLGSLPPVGGTPYGGYISNNVANNSIDVVFTNGPFVPALTWAGKVNGNWDLATTNWAYGSGYVAFANGDFVTFNDSLIANPTVTLTTTFTPATLVVSNSAENYVLTGAGSLSGSMTLAKNGPDSLTLSESGGDNFTGGILVNNGTLLLDDANAAISGGTTISSATVQIGNNDANGSVPGGTIADSGTLVFDSSANLIVTNPIIGTGALTQEDTSILTLSGDNSAFTGTATVSQGTLVIGNTNSVFATATSLTVSNGATLDTAGQSLYNGNASSTFSVTASGAGVGGIGAIVNNSTNANGQTLNIVNLTGNTTFGGMSSWQIRNDTHNSSSPADAALNGPNGQYNLTKVDTNTVTLRGVVIDGNLENVFVQAGGLHFTATPAAPMSSFGDPNGTITVYSNATVTLDTIGTIPGKNFVLTNGGTMTCSSTNTFADPLTFTGAANNTISVNSSSLFTITSPAVGNGGFSKNGSGTLYLAATNTYSGQTVVNGGTLALYDTAISANGTIASSSLINITGGATLDVSGRSDDTFTLGSGQTLTGGGATNPATINGILIANAGSILAPGPSSTNTGSILVTSNATLQGATSIGLNAATGGSDQLIAYAITYGGTLAVTNLFGTITNGQTFQLFVASNGVYNAGSFSGGVTLPTATGLTWTNNLTVNGTIAAGVVVVPPTQPNITGFNLTGNQLIISGTSSLTDLNYTYSLLTTTNVQLPLSGWTVLSAGNAFNPGGNFRLTNTVNQLAPQNYYLLRVP